MYRDREEKQERRTEEEGQRKKDRGRRTRHKTDQGQTADRLSLIYVLRSG